jgi:hypothetical protein
LTFRSGAFPAPPSFSQDLLLLLNKLSYERKLISVDKLTAEQVAELVVASLKARPTKAQRAEFTLGAQYWRAQKRIPLVYGRAS